jgi:diguanylate cyclase (GGDEF)-like protein
MKVGRLNPLRHASRVASAYAAQVAAASAPPAAQPVSPVSASLFGIPEGEFTPRVREAVTTLMHEVDRLRRELEQARAGLADAARSADQDMLLPVLNRRAFVREITRFIGFAERYGTPSSLVYFDLDHFKSINDRHGHAAGDAVLRQFAESLQRQIRETDVLARLGGDEFGVILAHITHEQALKKAVSLGQQLHASPPVWNGETLDCGFSFGVCELKAGETAETAIHSADQEMYAQKHARV